MSKIEWTEKTWNPIVGCSIVSPGCTNCYAMKQAARCEAMGLSRYNGLTRVVNGNAVWTGTIGLAPDDTMLAPLRRKKPTTYFVNSMGDLFHESCRDEWIDRVFAVMALSPQHTFQVLTKRAARMRAYFNPGRLAQISLAALSFGASPALVGRAGLPFPNVWIGVSTERQAEADERIPLLLQTPAAVRFISAEPLLGPIDLARITILPQRPGSVRAGIHLDTLRAKYCESGLPYKGDWDTTKPPPETNLRGLDWVITGGESGPNARPMHPDWVRSLREQCFDADVPFFFKQWGEWSPGEPWETAGRTGMPSHLFNNCYVYRIGKRKAGRRVDGLLHDDMPAPR